MRRRTAGYDSWKSRNSVSALIEKRRMAPVILFCGQSFVGGGSFSPCGNYYLPVVMYRSDESEGVISTYSAWSLSVT